MGLPGAPQAPQKPTEQIQEVLHAITALAQAAAGNAAGDSSAAHDLAQGLQAAAQAYALLTGQKQTKVAGPPKP